MDFAVVAAMVAFAFAAAASPGPNNTVLITLSATFGWRGSRGHLMGMVLGLGAMVLAVGSGLGAFFLAFPVVYDVLKYVGFAFIVYMAWGIFRSRVPQAGQLEGVPIGWWKSTLFQWVNPKAWIVIATYVTAYMPSEAGLGIIAVSAVLFVAVTLPGALLWVAGGRLVALFLTRPQAHRVFTTVMALALIASMVPVLFL